MGLEDYLRRHLLTCSSMHRAGSIAAVLAVLAVAGCGSSGTSISSTPASTTSAATQPAASAGGCHSVSLPKARQSPHLSAPTIHLDPSRTYTVSIVTNCGSFAFTLDVKQSPKTSASFYSLVKHGFFDGLIFHRVAAGFVIQGGDPTQTGGGGPGYTVVEAPPPNTQYVRGDVAMAKTETQPPGASGSQFFVVTAANATTSAGLTPDYALVGKVVSGMNVVAAIGRLPTNPPDDGEPTTPVVMSSVTVSVR
jgi:peptidyl-prolyl cis-trans isomerase B (cyclophilin B)